MLMIGLKTGARQAAINVAEGHKQATILASEAEKAEQINKAGGEAEAILLKAKATALGIEKVAADNGGDAVSMSVAEKYVEAFGKMAKEGTTLIVPATANDAGSMVAQALSVYNTINKAKLAEGHSSSRRSAPITAADRMREEVTRDLVNAAKKDPNNPEEH
jgi:regulator of protease activity HflC (stomatin/prohibitin superfamily)